MPDHVYAVLHNQIQNTDGDHTVNNDITRIIVTYCFFDHDTFQSYNETYGDDL